MGGGHGTNHIHQNMLFVRDIDDWGQADPLMGKREHTREPPFSPLQPFRGPPRRTAASWHELPGEFLSPCILKAGEAGKGSVSPYLVPSLLCLSPFGPDTKITTNDRSKNNEFFQKKVYFGPANPLTGGATLILKKKSASWTWTFLDPPTCPLEGPTFGVNFGFFF